VGRARREDERHDGEDEEARRVRSEERFALRRGLGPRERRQDEVGGGAQDERRLLHPTRGTPRREGSDGPREGGDGEDGRADAHDSLNASSSSVSVCSSSRPMWWTITPITNTPRKT